MLVRVTDVVLHYSFYILLFAVPFLFTPWNYELFEFNKMLATYALAIVIVSAWAIKCILSGKIIFQRTFLDIPLLLFLISQILSTYFSIDQHTSIWGYYSRSHGGLLSTTTYLMLYWAFVSNMGQEQVKTAIKYLLSSALIISAWGILEHFGLSPSCLIVSGELGVDCWVQDVQTRVFATLGQPNWLAAWIVAIIPLTWAVTISKIKNTKFIIWLGLGSLLFLALLYTKSRSGLLGFTAAYVAFWAMQLKYSTTHNIVRPFFIFTFSFLVLAGAVGTRWTPSLAELLHKTAPAPVAETTSPSETQLESGGTESGEIRKIVWKGALDIWRAYPLFGSGVETFAYSYYNFRPVEHNNTSEWNFLYNKAHNEYLNFAATTGAVGLGAYLLLIGAFLMWSTKIITNDKFQINTNQSKNEKFENWYLLVLIGIISGYVAILITNFFGFSVVNVATLFFLFPAMAVVMQGESDSLTRNVVTRNPTNESQVIKLRVTLLLFAVLLTTFYILLRLAQLWHADSLYAHGTTLSKNGQTAASAQVLSQALNIRPDEPNYLDAMASSLATVALDLAENNTSTTQFGPELTAEGLSASETAQLAQEASDRAIEISPRNLSILKSRSTTFYKLSFVDETYLLYSIEALERAVTLAPTDPKVHYNLGVLYANIGEIDKAKELFEKTLMLKNDFEDAKTGLQKLQE